MSRSLCGWFRSLFRRRVDNAADRPYTSKQMVPEILYRFRSMEALLNPPPNEPEERRKNYFGELERRQIYLAKSNELNDPMEGYKDVVWRGDTVLWENLLRHYVLSLFWTATQCLLMRDDAPFNEPKIFAALTSDDLPTPQARELYEAACRDFFQSAKVAALTKQLTSLARPLRADGVRLLLSLVHVDAFAAVTNQMRSRGLMPPGTNVLPKATDLEAIFKPYATNAPEVDLELLAFAANRVRDDQALAVMMQFEEKLQPGTAGKAAFMLFTFPDRYVQSIVDGLVHPPWRTACFSTTCTNASSWAVYGREHTGAALIFRPKTDAERPYIPLIGVNGVSGVVGKPDQKTRGAIKGELFPVRYENRPPEVDFFKSMGTLPRVKLDRAWHADRDGKRSPVIEVPDSERPAWRAAYWESFQRTATTKLTDWKHEEEWRIVMPDILGLHAETPDALVQYDFSCLVGIVFGVRTKQQHKVEAMKLIKAECTRTGRTDFEFHHVAYNSSKGCLVRI